jgi:hypothetical protein
LFIKWSSLFECTTIQQGIPLDGFNGITKTKQEQNIMYHERTRLLLEKCGFHFKCQIIIQ